jgi:hypothetical protein
MQDLFGITQNYAIASFLWSSWFLLVGHVLKEIVIWSNMLASQPPNDASATKP